MCSFLDVICFREDTGGHCACSTPCRACIPTHWSFGGAFLGRGRMLLETVLLVSLWEGWAAGMGCVNYRTIVLQAN